MPRLRTIDPAASEGRVREIFQGPLKGREKNIFKGMGNSAAALEVYLGTASALKKTGLSAPERESIQLALAHANGCVYCEAAHAAGAKGAGLSADEVSQARRGTMTNARLNALVKFALALHEKRGQVSDEDLARARAAKLTDGDLTEAVAVYALAVYTITFNHVNRTELDFPAAPAL